MKMILAGFRPILHIKHLSGRLAGIIQHKPNQTDGIIRIDVIQQVSEVIVAAFIELGRIGRKRGAGFLFWRRIHRVRIS